MDTFRGGEFRKSRRSGGNSQCVEIAFAADGSGAVGVRDSKDPAGPVLEFTADEWHAFIGGAKDGEFDQ